MGKLTSIILGVIAADLLAYYVISTEYSSIVNWFGPALGFKLIMILGYMGLFLGDPFKFPPVLFSWVAIGFVVSLGSRKALRSVGAAISVFLISLGILSITAYTLILPSLSSLQGTSITTVAGLSSFPPPPPGSSLGQILSSPVIGSAISVYSSLLSNLGSLGLSTTGSISPGSILSLIQPLIQGLIENIIILLLSAGIFGYLFSLATGERRKKRRNGSTQTAAILVVLVSLLAICAIVPLTETGRQFYNSGGTSNLAALQSSPASEGGNLTQFSNQTLLGLLDPSLYQSTLPYPAAQNSQGYYEGITSYVSGDGSVYNGYGFAIASNSTAPSGFFNMPGIKQSAITALVGVSNLPQFFLGQSGLNLTLLSSSTLSQFLGLAPREMLLQIYPGNISETSSLSTQSSAEAASGLSTQLTRVLAINIPLSTASTGEISIYLYLAGNQFNNFVQGFHNYTSSGFHSDGLIQAFNSQLISGAFNAPASSLDGSLLFSALINFNVLKSIFGPTASFGTLLNGSQYLSIVGGATVNNYAVHSSGELKNISLASTLSYTSKLFFSKNSGGSIVALGLPTLSGNSTLIPGVNFTAYLQGKNLTSFGNQSISLSGLPIYNSTTGIDPSSLSAQTNWTFPSDLAVNITGYDLPGGSIQVNTTVVNSDTSPVYNFYLNETSLQQYYGSYMANISGTTRIHQTVIKPGSEVKSHFTFTPTGVGEYVLWNLTEHYAAPTGNGSTNKTFDIQVAPAQFQVQPPLFLYAYNQVEYQSLSSLTSFFNFPYLTYPLLPGFYLFDLILVLIVLLDVYIEIRAYKRFKERKKKQKSGGTGGT